MEPQKIRETIKQAARELFKKNGFHQTSVNDIARQARVAKATIYKYFESKDLLLHQILMEYIRSSVDELIQSQRNTDRHSYLYNLILRTSRLSYTVCNEFIGWEFIRESTNAQEFLRMLSDDLETLLIESFHGTPFFTSEEDERKLRFLIKSSKSIVFSFAFTSVSDADVRKNFVSFQKEILPYLLKAAA